MRRGLILAARAKPKMIGARMMNPTSKNTGMPRTNAAAVTEATTRFGPSAAEKRCASESAPPAVSIRRPNIAPRPTTIITLDSVLPMPVVIVGMMSSNGIPAANAVPNDTSSMATNAGILTSITSNNSSTMAPSAMPSSAPAPMSAPFWGDDVDDRRIVTRSLTVRVAEQVELLGCGRDGNGHAHRLGGGRHDPHVLHEDVFA